MTLAVENRSMPFWRRYEAFEHPGSTCRLSNRLHKVAARESLSPSDFRVCVFACASSDLQNMRGLLLDIDIAFALEYPGEDQSLIAGMLTIVCV